MRGTLPKINLRGVWSSHRVLGTYAPKRHNSSRSNSRKDFTLPSDTNARTIYLFFQVFALIKSRTLIYDWRQIWLAPRNAAECAPRIFDFGLSSLGHRKRDLWEPCALKLSNPKGVDDGFSELRTSLSSTTKMRLCIIHQNQVRNPECSSGKEAFSLREPRLRKIATNDLETHDKLKGGLSAIRR